LCIITEGDISEAVARNNSLSNLSSIRSKLAALKAKIIRSIPVYGHYREEEDLREWDRSVRDEAIASLNDAERSIARLLSDAVQKRDRNSIGKIESLRKECRSRRETIRTAAYAFWPRFSPIKIDGNVLTSVLNLDESVLQECDGIRVALQSPVGTWETDLSGRFKKMDNLLNSRMRLLRTGKVEES
jgi:hypothetical protein